MTFGGDTSLICGGMSLGHKHYIERIGNPITLWTKKEKNVNLMFNYHFSCVNDDSSHFLSDYNLQSLSGAWESCKLSSGSHISKCVDGFPWCDDSNVIIPLLTPSWWSCSFWPSPVCPEDVCEDLGCKNVKFVKYLKWWVQEYNYGRWTWKCNEIPCLS